ncbi:MAG: hypothetical protein KDC35_03510 [Acidobacteria bacterium]|nr:hypothetical protein [Acidobacteriota bacterium]
MEHFWGMTEIASAHGGDIDRLIAYIHYLMLALFVFWGGFFILALIKFRGSRPGPADYAGVKGKFSTYLEVVVALIEAVLLIGFSIPLWAERVNEFPTDKANEVRLVAEQFAWNVHYPGPDGVFGKTSIDLVNNETNPIGLDRNDPAAADDITTINQLHLENNKPIIVHLSSKDVIHSFGIPHMRIKHDVIPGMSIPVWFTPVKTGAFEIACAQLCGLGHYRMKGFVTVHEPTEYQAWMDEQAALLAEEGEGDDFWD